MGGDQQLALDRAAVETYRRIDVDLSESPEPLQPILEEIRDRLFDVGYGPPPLGRKRRRGPETPARAFQSYLGETPLEYLRDARLETSMRLLRDADLAIGAIALLVGYADGPGFRHAFRKRLGLLPRHFRGNVRRIAKHPGWPDDEILSFHLWQRATAGEATAIERLRGWVRTLHPRAKVPKTPEPAEEKLWRRLAEVLWAKLSLRPPSEQYRALRHGLYVGHPALFHLLAEESARAEDPRRGLELAELAAATVEGSAEVFGELLPSLRFLARVRLAEARRRT